MRCEGYSDGESTSIIRELARMLGVEKFLIAFDSAAPSSAVFGNFPSEDFSFHKKWLMDNVGSPKNSLEEMQIELEDCYDLEGYYWEAVV